LDVQTQNGGKFSIHRDEKFISLLNFNSETRSRKGQLGDYKHQRIIKK
jgi:hypothetical protein